MHRLSLSGREAPRPPRHHQGPHRLSLTHSFIATIIRDGHDSRAISPGPRPSPGTPSQPPRRAAQRGPPPSDAVARAPPRRAPGTRVPASAWAAPERPRPQPCQPRVSGLRPDSPRQTCRVRGATERASMETARPRFSDPPRARRPGTGAWEGGSGPPATHLLRVRSEGPVPSRLKPLRPPHTPQCPRCLLVLDRPPTALSLVHLKGLWARAARRLKGAVRNSVSLGTRAAFSRGERWGGHWSESCPSPGEKAQKRCVGSCASPAVSMFVLLDI